MARAEHGCKPGFRERLGSVAERAEGEFVLDAIPDDSPIAVGEKAVRVLPPVEWPVNHFVAKVRRAILTLAVRNHRGPVLAWPDAERLDRQRDLRAGLEHVRLRLTVRSEHAFDAQAQPVGGHPLEAGDPRVKRPDIVERRPNRRLAFVRWHGCVYGCQPENINPEIGGDGARQAVSVPLSYFSRSCRNDGWAAVTPS